MSSKQHPQTIGALANRLINETEAANYLGYTTRALQNWRVRGGGPVFVKVSARSVRYRIGDLDKWVTSKLVKSTSDNDND